MGLLGHSDADVLIHAICDALLGAANMRDIGYHFPDTAGEFKNIDSKILLAETVDLITAKGYKVDNVDATICAGHSKLKRGFGNAVGTCSFDGIDVDDVSVRLHYRSWVHGQGGHFRLCHCIDESRTTGFVLYWEISSVRSCQKV